MDKKIYTFWEPKDNIPAYLKLCMQTWKKFLPEFQIVILDYSNISEYLEPNCFDDSLYKNFPLAKQADAIRCAILKTYGGVWFDVDTIITSAKVRKFFNIKSDFILFGNHIACIFANKDAYILQRWAEELQKRISTYKKLKAYTRYFDRNMYRKIKDWNYLGNDIIDKYLDRVSEKDFYRVNRIESGAIAELNYYEHIEINNEVAYKKFYFENNFVDYITKYKNDGIILLHNSWTPNEYKQMSVKEFLSCKNTLSELLNNILF